MDLVDEKFPKTVAAAADKLSDQFTPAEKVKVAHMSKTTLTQFHKSLKNYILTEFRLPGNGPLMKSCGHFMQEHLFEHNEASYIIVRALQLKLQETAFIKIIK